MDFSQAPTVDDRHGPPTRKQVLSSLEARSWYNLVAAQSGETRAIKVEALFRSGGVPVVDGKSASHGHFHRFRAGKRVPKEVADRVGRVLPTSLFLAHHPFWFVAQLDECGLQDVFACLKRCHERVKRQYLTVHAPDEHLAKNMIVESLGSPIWIGMGNWEAALDHLAMQIAYLKTDWVQHSPKHFPEVARNVVKTLGPIAQSPCFSAHYEELFDFLEAGAWRCLLTMDHPNVLSRGWRTSISKWLIENFTSNNR